MASVTHLFKKCFVFSTLIFSVLLFIAVIRTILITKDVTLPPCTSNDTDFISDARGLSYRLAQALKFKTIAFSPSNYDVQELEKLVEFLKKSYPQIHSAPFIKREVVNNLSLLYTVSGSDVALKPYMLSGHLDVVPVEEAEWEVLPFSGLIKDGYIWGRGAIDAKDIVLGIMEALEYLIENKFHPHRSFYIAFGHDEEVGGLDGACHISKLLQSRGVQLEYLLDEGTFILNNSVPGLKVPVAMVGVSEKGSMNLNLTVKTSAGHSSVPPKETAIVILSKAVAKLSSDVFPSMLGEGPDADFFHEVSPYASFLYRVVYSNFWLFKPILSWRMGLNNLMSAIIRTTTAVTMISGGIKTNILPSKASATVNFRIHPAQTTTDVVKYIKHIINDDRVELEVESSFEPHHISPSSDNSFGYMVIKQSIQQIFPESCVAPVVCVGNTDTRWYLGLTKAVYRFSAANMKPEETSRFHGHNEKISIYNYEQIVNFYYHLIQNSDKDLKMKLGHIEL